MGEVALITGTSSGLGEMSALELARAGYTVFATMREAEKRNKPKADQFRAIAQSEGVDLRPLEMDVSDQASVDRAVRELLQAVDHIDVLVHNAGHMNLGPTEAFTVEQMAELYDTNTLSTQRVNRAVLPHMRHRRKGLLIWISSTTTKATWPFYLAPYFAAKAGMEQLAISYAAELSRWGIESVLIVPGAFSSGTNHFQHAMQPQDEEVAKAYAGGPTEDLAKRLLEATQSLEPEDSDPSEVGRALLRVVQAPPGSRPFRTTIDPSRDGSEIVSAMQDRLREDTLRRVGLDALLKPT